MTRANESVGLLQSARLWLLDYLLATYSLPIAVVGNHKVKGESGKRSNS